jgi:hypothetical protein
MSKLSDIQLVLLSNAAARDDGALTRPANAHPPALGKAIKKLLEQEFVSRKPATATVPAWDKDPQGTAFALVITSAGLDAIGVVQDPAPAPEAVKKLTASHKGLDAAVETAAQSQTNLDPSTDDTSSTQPSRSRSNSKLSRVVEMLRTPEGVSIADLMKATDWQAHSVRGAIAGAIKKKLGLSVISERRGDERFYRIAG